MDNIKICLWFDGTAEEAARFYTTLIPDSHIDSINEAAADTPSGPKGTPLTVEFTLAGRSYVGLNGGPEFTFTEAISLQVLCDDQAEVDRLWEALIADGGEPSACGWLKDRFGLSWQIVPRRMLELFESPDRAAAERAMLAMLAMGKLDIAAAERAYGGEAIPTPG